MSDPGEVLDDLPLASRMPRLRYGFIGRPPQRTIAVDLGTAALWGLPHGTLLRQPDLWLAGVHPQDRARLRAAWASNLRWDLAYRVRRPDGSLVVVRDQGLSRLAKDGPQLFGSVQDVTEQLQLQEELRFQSQLLDAVAQCVVATDEQGMIRYWNRAAEELFGWPAGEIVGRPLREVVPLQRGRPGATGEPPPDGAPREILTRDHRAQPLLLEERTSPIRDPSGAVTGTVVVMTDIRARKRSERRLLSSERELRQLYADLHAAREAEQTRFARELHDQLGQMLTALKLDMAWLRRRAEAMDGEQMRERLSQATQLVDDTLEAARRMARDLRPVVLDDLGLAAALEWLVEDMARRAGLEAHLDLRLGEAPASPHRDNALFRIVQEALTNVVRHARARRVTVRAVHRHGSVVLSVRDDGHGIPARALRRSGLGIVGMRERVRAFGGTLTVRRLSEGGTRVCATLPDRTTTD